MSPTSTDGLPPVIACASGVWIWRMSHCKGDEVSWSVAGELGRLPGGGPLASREDSPFTGPRLIYAAKALVPATPSLRSPLMRLSLNLLLAELAITTPVCVRLVHRVPPAC